MMIQTVLVLAVVAMAVAYAAWRMTKVLRRSQSPCDSCSGCALKGKIDKNELCEAKKTQNIW
ncbi:MAG: FeoB-associated Cys-rich membrane protein [Prevotella sp.]|nr:FeoB-associated Cys-rich membrane protein [Prevotella sp.]